MKSMQIAARCLTLTLAVTVAACGSDGGNTGTTADTAGAGDTAAGDTGSLSDGGASDGMGDGAGDASSGTDGGTSDGGKTDAGQSDGATTDTSKPDPKCAPSDQSCVVECRGKKCGKEASACTTNPKCIQLNGCLGGCAQTPPVSPPAEVTGTTCQAKCQTLAGDEAASAYNAVTVCLVKQCVESPYDPDKKCAQTDEACLNACVTIECGDEMEACDKDAGCGDALKCASACKDQGCVQQCLAKTPPASQMTLGGLITCMQGCVAQ